MFEIELSEEENFYKLQNMVLSSFPVLRKVFQARWKKETGKDWEPTPEQGQRYIRGLGSEVYNKADRVQKTIIQEGNPEDWDLTLLAKTILNLGDARAYKKENDSVRKLKTLRNVFAHRTKSKLPREEYQAHGKIFQASMKGLGVRDELIDHIISISGTTSSDVAFKMAKRLYDKAKIHIKKNKFERAIERCNDAVQLPSLLANQKATTFLNRGECYLKFATYKKYENRNEHDGCIDEAIRDGNRALELCEACWKAEYLIGRAHRMKNSFEDAILHLTKALALSPNQKNVKEELYSCKSDYELQSSPDMYDPSMAPTTLNERMAEVRAETGRRITRKQFVRQWKRKCMCVHQAIPGQRDYLNGIQYIEGSYGLPKNEVQAVRYFRQAVAVGNPGAMHSLALCYEEGTGVERDISKAFQLYLQGANTPTGCSGCVHPGVAYCQKRLGIFYESGIFVERDLSEAARWYKMAADNGSDFAAHNLANLYYTGSGVPTDEKMAEKYWTQAAKSKDPLATSALMDYYIRHLEPEKALKMLQQAKSIGNTLLQGIDVGEVEHSIERVRVGRDQQQAALVAFEKEQNLEPNGCTFLERMRRKLKSGSPEDKKIAAALQICMCPYCLGNKASSGHVTLVEINMDLIRSKARQGSVPAAAILKTLEISRNLIQFMEGKDTFKDKQKLKVLHKLYECATREFDAVYFPDEIQSKLKQLIVELVDSKCGKEGEEDMKIRFVHAKLNYTGSVKGTPSYSVELLKQGIRMYNDNVHYYELLSSICVYEKDSESGLSYATKGLEKFPGNLNLLFFKALSQLGMPAEKMKMTDVQKRVAVVAAYKDYLNKASRDELRVAEAYYGIAAMYLETGDRESMKHFFNLGKEAEKSLLLPRATSQQKRLLEKSDFFEKLKEKERGAASTRQEVARPEMIFESKPHLNNPLRRKMITQFRQQINDQGRERPAGTCQVPKPKVTQAVPDRMFQVKPITLKEMNPTATHFYEDRVMDLTIIDLPNCYCHCPGIHLLAEDENGDVTRLNIYNMTKTKETLEEFGFGAKIAILNPYMHIGERPMETDVRVDCLDCLIFLENVENMCRFCGEPSKKILTCAKCKKAVYCSKECQMHDWKIMMHKLIHCANFTRVRKIFFMLNTVFYI